MKRSAPGKVGRQSRILQPLLFGKERNVCVSERSKTIELVKTVNQQKKYVHWCRHSAVSHEPLPQLPPSHPLKPKHEQEENASSDEIEARGQPRQQVQPKRGASPE